MLLLNKLFTKYKKVDKNSNFFVVKTVGLLDTINTPSLLPTVNTIYGSTNIICPKCHNKNSVKNIYKSFGEYVDLTCDNCGYNKTIHWTDYIKIYRNGNI